MFRYAVDLCLKHASEKVEVVILAEDLHGFFHEILGSVIIHDIRK